MAPTIYNKNISQSKLLMYNPMPVLQKKNIAARQISKTRTVVPLLGLSTPFQPSMWDEKAIQSAWSHALEMVKSKLKNRYSKECGHTILARLEKLFPKLNYNTHRRSLAIILSSAAEKVIYLSFPVKPVAFLSKSISILDLAANIQKEADFYYFVLNEGSVSLYDYNNKQLRKVYEQSNETCQVNLFRNASITIELLNSKYEKPVFITGRPNIVKRFCDATTYPTQFFTLLYYASPFNDEIIQSHMKEIILFWSYWQSKFYKAKILLARKAGTLITHIDAVLRALEKCADGLLLLDKHLKHQLQKSSIGGAGQLAEEFRQQFEKFLVRGNRIEITESGLLKDFGGIVLLLGGAGQNSKINTEPLYHVF